MMSTIYGLIPIEANDQPTTFVTEGMVMGYNSNFLVSLDDDEGAFVLLHETFHHKLNFFDRLAVIGEEFIEDFNSAQDFVINVMLRDAGWKVPKIGLLPAKYGFPEGLTTEEYFDLLRQRRAKQQKSGGNSAGGTGGEGKSGNGSSIDIQGVCGGQCTIPKSARQPLNESIGRSDANVKAIYKKAAQDIADAIKRKGRGSVPGCIAEWAALEEEESFIRWEDRLQHLIRDASGRIMSGGDDFSMRHPSKRSHVRRLIRPGLIDQQVVPYFVFDTSLSMDMAQMMCGVRESVAILKQLGIDEAYVAQVDASVAMEPRMINLSYFEGPIEFKGRGGTDFRPAFEAIDRMPQKPDIMFYWTDGEGPAPKDPPPGLEVLWCIVPGSYLGIKPANWGHIVVISEDPKKQLIIESAQAYGADEDDDDP